MTIDTEKLRAIAEAAGDGPWSYDGDGFIFDVLGLSLAEVASAAGQPEAAHIATFDPPTVLALLHEIDRLRGALARTSAGRDGNSNTGHGHVFPRPDRVIARCGGPRMCAQCAADLARATEYRP